MERLRSCLLSSTSSRDFKNESHYHAFMVGLLSGVTSTHYFCSNKESGLGFLDLALIPRNPDHTEAIIMELKHLDLNKLNAEQRKSIDYLSEQARLGVIRALRQINLRGYDLGLSQYSHIQRVIKIGMVFTHRWVSAGCIATVLERGEALEIVACDENDIHFY
jgi:hypothetical protein